MRRTRQPMKANLCLKRDNVALLTMHNDKAGSRPLACRASETVATGGEGTRNRFIARTGSSRAANVRGHHAHATLLNHQDVCRRRGCRPETLFSFLFPAAFFLRLRHHEWPERRLAFVTSNSSSHLGWWWPTARPAKKLGSPPLPLSSFVPPV